MPSIQTTRAYIHREGQPLTLTRPGVSSIDVTGQVLGYAIEELTEDIYQGDRQVTISNQEIDDNNRPGPPARADRIVIDGKTATVEAVETRRLRGQIERHVIQVRGG